MLPTRRSSPFTLSSLRLRPWPATIHAFSIILMQARRSASPAGLTTQVGFTRLAHSKCPTRAYPSSGGPSFFARSLFAKKMDCRVKPGNDGGETSHANRKSIRAKRALVAGPGNEVDAVTVLFHALLCCAFVMLAASGSAQTWPSRPIKLIVPTGPGAATDLMARLVAEGCIAHARPIDGGGEHAGRLRHPRPPVRRARARSTATRSCSPTPREWPLTSSPSNNSPYDPTRDFTAVALVCSLGPQMLSVQASLPVSTVAGLLIAYAKSNPGRLSIAFDNTAGAAAFAAKLFNKRADLGLIEVPYRSAAQMDPGRRQRRQPGHDELDCRRQRCGASRQGPPPRRHLGQALSGLARARSSLRETVPGIVMDGFFAYCGARGHAGRGGGAAQSRDRPVSKRAPTFQERLLSLGLATEGAGTPESAAQTIRRGAGGVARAGKGTGRRAAVTML